MKHFLHRFRPINLFIVAITQLLVFFVLLKPVHEASLLHYSNIIYYIIVAITVLVCAAGYIINDICDIEIDRVNKPHKVIQNISLWMNVYRGVFIIGLILTIYLSYLNSSYLFTPIYLLSFLSMYWYSTKFKCQPLIGNIIVSAFSAGVVLVLLGPAFWDYWTLDKEMKGYMLPFLLFAVMSFLLSLVREIIKDIQDVDGDRENDCNTLAVSAGTEKAKIFAIFFGVILTVFLLAFAHFFFQQERMVWTVGLSCISVWNIFLMISLLNNTSKAKNVQKQLKIMMFIGLLLLLIEPYLHFFLGW